MVTVIGVDIGKNRFHPVGLDNRGAIVLRRLTGRMAHSQARGAAELRWEVPLKLGLRVRDPSLFLALSMCPAVTRQWARSLTTLTGYSSPPFSRH